MLYKNIPAFSCECPTHHPTNLRVKTLDDFKEHNLDEAILLDFLKQQESPVLETTLLRKFFPALRDKSLRDLDLSVVQMHFILYHHLYRLVDSLRDSGYVLHIHYIFIYLIEKPKDEYCPHFDQSSVRFCLAEKETQHKYCDFHLREERQKILEKRLTHRGIKDYYLNFENFNLLENEYNTLIHQADQLKKYTFQSVDLEESYRLLGLKFGASYDRVRLAFKTLAWRYHPDVTSEPGSIRRFKAITRAYNIVKEYLKPQT